MKPSQPQSQLQNQHSINRLAQSIFVVNRHAKAATNPKYLYWLKKTALERLIAEKKQLKKDYTFLETHVLANNNLMSLYV